MTSLAGQTERLQTISRRMKVLILAFLISAPFLFAFIAYWKGLAYLLRLPGGSVLLDCGQTTLTGLSASAIDREEIEAIVVSHFHADHFGGIPLFLLGSVYDDARRNPLQIVGPPQTGRADRRVYRTRSGDPATTGIPPIHFRVTTDADGGPSR